MKMASRDKMIMMLMILVFCFICINSVKVEAQSATLVASEVEALKEIATQIGKKDWNFSIDPCSNHTTWATPKSTARPLFNNTVTCDCSFSDGACHVTSIFLTGQDLAGVLPPSIEKLPYLINVDFSWNYLNGSIPREWASMKLQFLSLIVNNLSGPIPSYLGNITTLTYLSIENNMFSGTVPPELGNLVNLRNLFLTANNLIGELPVALMNLTKLTKLRINSNNFTGRIPDIFQSWNQLQKLEIQASGLEGPIPCSISVLSNLTELMISGLNGGGSVFPNLTNMIRLQRLMLRSCNLSGPIPSYLSAMSGLKILDLSFNRLVGSIPDLADLTSLQNLYLTSNLLTGSIPEWIKSRDRCEIDVSYNNFSESSEPPSCTETLNVFKSFSARDSSLYAECLKSSPCPKDQYSLHINCGGKATTIGEIMFEADQNPGGAAHFVPSGPSWGFSSTGHFWDLDSTSTYYVEYVPTNVSILRMDNSEFYTDARLSPLSLTYYGRCFGSGNYTVKLYFSEIIIRGNKSFSSLGRRIFDVYIQEKLVLKDFDIEKDAQGVDKAVIREFKAVEVKKKTLEIRFHWSGKGKTASPKRGVYGPLISAISIESGCQKTKSRRILQVHVWSFLSLLCTIPSVENQNEKGVASGFSVFLFLSFVENML